MGTRDSGGPAFPHPDGHLGHNGDWISHEATGMTLRDYFAGQVLAQLPVKWDAAYSKLDYDDGRPEREAMWSARAAYRMADAMLKARNEA